MNLNCDTSILFVRCYSTIQQNHTAVAVCIYVLCLTRTVS